MQIEFENFRFILEEKKKKYKDKISRLEAKFYEEKSKLQKQFALKIAEVKRASHEVCMPLEYQLTLSRRLLRVLARLPSSFLLRTGA
jgi:predicted nuclease with TOPRIM domain